MGTQPRIDFITLGVPSLDDARRFFVDGLGWPALFDVPGEIVFVQVNHGLTIGFFGRDDLARDSTAPLGEGPAPMSLSCNFDSESEVVAEVDRWRAAGATVLKEPQKADFGGFHAYLADPAGFRWELCHNPGWSVDADGTVHIGPVDG
jgi:catechol 2,3-dioxygenase-like lactoylglutathione lyase family enzyme